jgi:Tripartite tricarboxylate transporter family receptor
MWAYALLPGQRRPFAAHGTIPQRNQQDGRPSQIKKALATRWLAKGHKVPPRFTEVRRGDAASKLYLMGEGSQGKCSRGAGLKRRQSASANGPFRRRNFVGWVDILCFAVLLQVPIAARAAEKPKDYPNRPITVIVPGPAGGISDVGVRLMAESLNKLFGHTLLADNKPGAAGQIAYTDFKNNAKPDGYTISQVSGPHIHAIVLDPTRKPMEDAGHVKRVKDIGLALKLMSAAEYGKFLEEQDEWVKPLISLYRK